MQPTTSPTQQDAATPFPAIRVPEYATMGAVHLDVTDLQRSIGFWVDLIGLTVLSQSAGSAALGVGETPLVVLHGGAVRSFQPRYSGLYHLAIHLPDEPEFARILARLITNRYRISPTDHIMSKAIYLLDPDGITLEITLETPERVRRFALTGGMPDIIDSEGRSRGGAEPLDVREVLNTLADRNYLRLLPAGTKIGHVHLYVSDLEETFRFYRDDLGFIEHMHAPSMGMSDLFAGGTFPHRIAMNTWQSAGRPQAPAGTAGMRHFTITYGSPERLHAIAGTLRQVDAVDGGFVTRDPAGNTVFLTA